jgi:hypothetical protein
MKKQKTERPSHLKKNKMGVYIKLLETDVWIHETNIAMELAIEMLLSLKKHCSRLQRCLLPLPKKFNMV